MKIYNKSGLFILSAILVTIFIFGSAALCSFCGIPLLNTGTGAATEENAQAQQENETVAAAESNENITEESKDTAEETEEVDAADQAGESVAEEETAEESVEEAADAAAESESSEESSPESAADGEVGTSESITSIAPDSYMSGTILQGEIFPGTAMAIRIGDSETKTQFKGYLSFNIEALHGKTVLDAEINILELERYNNPGFAPYLDVKAFNYGTLDGGDFAVGGTTLERIPTSMASYNITGETLKNEVQKILDSADNDYFQIKLGLSTATDNDTASDCFFIHYNKVGLYISYID
jgi:hypothetical protein